MKPIYLSVLIAVIPCCSALAADESGDRDKVKKDLFMPECSWSKMSKDEYEACQKKRSTMKVMTPEERARYLKETEGGGSYVEGVPGQTRRNIRQNIPSGGGRR